MKYEHPCKVLMTGGHEIGGVDSFAEGLRAGFTELGVPVEIIPPSHIFLHWRELRDPRILKILSTTAIYAAPIARRSICMAHGVPRVDHHGWWKMIGIIISHNLANCFSGTQVVAVSHFTAAVVRAFFNTKIHAVILNPLKPLYLEPNCAPPQQRCYVTYVGRLIGVKKLDRILPSIRALLDETPGLRACIIGEGNMRAQLEALVEGDPRFEFKGTPDDETVRDLLRRTRIFFSGNQLEGLGITYLEAISQGCIVVMPAAGGGMEIALDKIGKSVQLFPLSWEKTEMLSTLRRALNASFEPIDTTSFSAKAVAGYYLQVDARFSTDGRIRKMPYDALPNASMDVFCSPQI
jgi:glycosyltransferase involved in cell wall biosynthesis